MSKVKSKRQEFSKKIFTKRRLVVLNENTFEEIFSLKLNLMNVFVIMTISAIFLIAITTCFIVFTPFREYIPGYASTKLKQEATFLAIKSDSIEQALQENNAYTEMVRKVLMGEIEKTKINKDSISASVRSGFTKLDLTPIQEDLDLRKQVAMEDKYNLFETTNSTNDFKFYSPVKGQIVQKYTTKSAYILVKTVKNIPIKSIDDGVVLFSGWTPIHGNVIIIYNKNGFLSIYKNGISITKNQGDRIRSGEVIAISGDGESAQLRFELWKDGNPVDPTNFVDFE